MDTPRTTPPVPSADVQGRKLPTAYTGLPATLMDAMPVVHVVVDRDGKVIYWNHEAEKLYGWTAAEALGKDGVGLTTTLKTRRAARRVIARVRRTGKAWTGEAVVNKLDGTPLPIWVSVMPLRDAAGTVVAMLGLVVDITAKKKAKEKERASQDRLAAILEQLPVGVGVTNTRGRVILSNRVLRSLAPEFLPSIDASNVHRWLTRDAEGHAVSPDQWPGQRALRGETVAPGLEFLLTTDDGRSRWMLESAAPLRREGGAITGAIVIVEDITERKKAETALRDSEERFRLMADNLPLIVWLHDDVGRQTFVNQTFCDYFGVSREEMRGGRWQVLTHPDDGQAYVDEFMRCVRERQPFHARVRVKRADGNWRWMESWARPLFLPSGEFQGHVGTSADVTEREAAEEALREAAAHRDQFLATLSHEIRNPLAALRSGVEVLDLAQGDPATVRGIVPLLQQGISHLTHLVNDLLDVTRLQRGQVTLHKERIDLRRVIDEAVQYARPLLTDKRQALSLALPDVPLVVEGDKTRLVQALSNLLDNAVKYTPEGGRVALTVQSAERNVTIIVQDTGKGIAADFLPRVFDLFAQESHRPQSTYGGLGLGLPVVKNLVEMHGGTVTAGSPGPNQGSTFAITLPRLLEPATQEDSVPVTSPEVATPHALRILLVEDNEGAAQAMMLLLERLGHIVRRTASAEAALQLASSFRPDVALVDIGLPQMDGYELARRLRVTEGLAECRLLALTGYGTEADRQQALAAGFAGHLTKPVDLYALQTALQ